ncbi:DUF6151 family protein [Hirschia litorea]|uniref:DUF6151 family protein n=1 Tax=Hirschia litorea TaxID=1199156 RepID=A0ABW2IGP9_9PROT
MQIGCACGKVSGRVEKASSKTVNRIRCYCRDCQAGAYLTDVDKVLDSHGGTEIYQTSPALISFHHGLENIGCTRLAGKGLMRWHSTCCNTAIANTLEDRKFAFVGLVHTCVQSPEMGDARDQLIGAQIFDVNTGGAKNGPIKRIGQRRTIFKILSGVLKAKVTGTYKMNPFFDAVSGKPIVKPRVLSGEESAAIYQKVDQD